MQLVNDNTDMVNQRDKEIANIVRSIQDLNDIFKDLSQMVVDQVGNSIFCTDFLLFWLFCHYSD